MTMANKVALHSSTFEDAGLIELLLGIIGVASRN